MFRFLTVFTLFFSLLPSVSADVVKPALVEISVFSTGKVTVEVRASIEALLTGINAQYKNTQDAPQADEYDELRALQSGELQKQFESFKQNMLNQIELNSDNKRIDLRITSTKIPPPGYTKVPRISVITLSGKINNNVKNIQWYYPAAFGDNAVRVRQVDTDNEKWHWSSWQWIRKDEPSQPFSLDKISVKPPVLETIWSYMTVGFLHIVPKGTDHILFIIGIFLLSLKLKPLLWQVTMFTAAHTITLGMSINGVISLPSNIVEPLIALSIAYIGVENIMAKSLHRSRLFLVFGFGLLHGLGFAGVLNDFGMPDDDFVLALISFNVGVEFGQLAVLALAFLAVGLWFRKRDWYHDRITVPGSVFIALIGTYWTLERLTLI